MDRRTESLGRDPVGPLLLRLSLPGVVGMLVQASYNVVDALFIGRGVGPLGLAGTAVAFPLQLLILAMGTFGGVGAQSLISRALGARDLPRAQGALGVLGALSLALGGATALGGLLGLDPLLRLAGASSEVLPYARAYMRVILLGVPALILGVALSHAVRAEGDARTPMQAMLLSAGANTILDPLFIFGLRGGVAGAAWATVISQVLMTLWLLRRYRSGSGVLRLRLREFRFRRDLLGEIASVGASEWVRLSANGFIVGVVVHALGTHGSPLAVAAYGIVSRLLSLAFMPLLGLAQGFMPLLGYNYGAGLHGRARRVLVLSVRTATVFSTAVWLLCLVVPSFLVAPFTSHPELLALGSRSLRVMTLGFFCVGFQILGAGTFQALGKARPALFLSLSRQVLLFLPLLLVLPRWWGLWGVWLSFPLSDLLSALLTLPFFLPQMRELEETSRERVS